MNDREMIYDEAYYLKRDLMIVRGALQRAFRGEVSYEDACLAALPVTEAAAQGGYPEHRTEQTTQKSPEQDHAHEHWLVPLNACEPYAKSCATCNETFEADELVVFVNETDKVITALIGGHCKSVLPGDTLTVPASSLPGGFIPVGLTRAN